MAPPPSPAPQRPGAVGVGALRAVASAVLLLALAGLPWLLWEATWAAAPDGVDDLTHLLSRQDTSGAFLLALAATGWLGWASLALSLLVEIPAQLRGRTAPRLPGLRLGQRAAATLVGGVLVLLPIGTATAAPASVPVAAPQAPEHEGPAAADEDAGPEAARPTTAQSQAGPGPRAYTVRDARPAESLWQIAERELGGGERYTAIADLNEHRTMADGSVFHADAPIKPGWTLLLPPGRTTPASSSSAPRAGFQLHGALREDRAPYTVQPGDSLSLIAQQQLGDGDEWPALYRANREQIADPDLIHPGQRLDLPARAEPTAPERPAEPAPPKQPDAPAPPDRPGADAGVGRESPDASAEPPAAVPSQQTPARPDEAPDRDEVPPPHPSPAESGGPETGAEASEPPTAEEPAAAADSAGEDSAITSHGPLAVGIGALLAASLAGALGVKRILQQRRRRAGETIAVDADPSALEQVLNASAAPDGVALLESALRTLAHNARATRRELPTVRGARVADRSVQLVLEDPSAEPLPPFTSGDAPDVWSLDPKTPLLDDDADQTTLAPFPGLVTLGSSDDGALQLVDLLRLGTLLLEGDPADVLAVARAVALEAGTSSWSDHTEILTVGLGARLAGLLPQGRIRALPHVPSVIADLGGVLVEAHQRNADHESAPPPLPWILVCATDVDAEQAWQLADAISAARELPIAAVLPANAATRRAFPDAEPVSVAPDTAVTLPHAAGPVRLQRLTDDQYRQYVHALNVAEQPAQSATGTWQLAEDHELAAAAPRPAPARPSAPATAAAQGDDLSSPFPALLASADPSLIRLPHSAAPTAAHSDEPDHTPAGLPDDAAEPPELADEDAHVPDAPEINVLGPLQVTGTAGSGHGPKIAALAALILLRPGRTIATLCSAMDPVSPWSARTLQSRLSEIRSRFGSAPDGAPYLPRHNNGYAFHFGVRSDWDRFQRLAARALAAGPTAGIPDLEDALGLVRGRPFDGRDFPWADSVQQEMLSRVVDVAHTLATWHAETDPPDLDAARQAALRGLDIDETAEVLYRDWMHIERAAGNTSGVHKAIARVQHVTRANDVSVDPLTEQTIAHVLSDRQTPVHAGQG
ncbi:LysM peptidoglycan-binding domain-containing protein [Streptomyces sp. NPDC051907]|uniref:LysM peptidoglycan-binding domain-containing protein n=1 Tax=Streptomyces sp. NPDC051907 TaxID=3155284 RepID=UPI00341D23E0